MPSFTVSDLKDRASKLKDASVHKIGNTRDKYSSQSSSKYVWDPNVKPANAPPPLPATRSSSVAVHSRTSSNLSTSSVSGTLPPPPSRTAEWSRPSSVAPSNSRSDQIPEHTPSPPPAGKPQNITRPLIDSSSAPRVDWANLSEDDKQIFFSWLDEFFQSRLNITLPIRKAAITIQQTSRPVTPPRPPTLPIWSRPTQQQYSFPQEGGQVPQELNRNIFTLSYPPPTMHGSSAADLAHYFSPSTHWNSAWYTSSDLPPPFKENAPPTYTAVWEMRGATKTIFGGVVFADLSVCWYSVQFPTAGNADTNDVRVVKRSARYLSRPEPKDRAALVEAHETYGETIAAFAESFEGTGQYCARGECWDLASEALKYFDQYDYVPKPVPSLSRTHGHLIFEGRASRKGAEQVGRWRGGDDRVRRGDIVEWRSVRIGMPSGGWSTLGQPDHTAVIVSDSVPQVQASDGGSVRPSQLGSLEVVEQSVGSPPARQRYDLSRLEEGEMWIYRPIALENYVGTVLGPKCPDHLDTLSI